MVNLRFLVTVLVILLVAATWLSSSSTAQDTDAERISALETAVAELTERVETLESQAATGTNRATGEAAPSGNQHTIRGELVLLQGRDESLMESGPCIGVDGYGDLTGGARVIVRNAAGDTIATSTLDDGTYLDDQDIGVRPGRQYACAFQFTVDVPEEEFYSIEISRREGPTYSFAELDQMGWRVQLVIGEPFKSN